MIILTTIVIESFSFTAYYPCSKNGCHLKMAAREQLIERRIVFKSRLGFSFNPGWDFEKMWSGKQDLSPPPPPPPPTSGSSIIVSYEYILTLYRTAGSIPVVVCEKRPVQMDDSSYGRNFDLDYGNDHSWKEHLKMSKIAKFGREML